MFQIKVGDTDVRAYSGPLLGATNVPSLAPRVLKKIFLLEMVKNDICLGCASKQNAFFQKICPKKRTLVLNARIGSGCISEMQELLGHL